MTTDKQDEMIKLLRKIASNTGYIEPTAGVEDRLNSISDQLTGIRDLLGDILAALSSESNYLQT
jgi:hypothetical protein